MEMQEGLLTRRSIRRYVKDKKVETRDLMEILQAGMYAPSAMNRQPWEFLVIDDEEKINHIMQVHPYCSFLKDAGTAIVVCGNLNEQMADNYWMGDCAAATENILLAAHAKGLGTCWCGVYPTEQRMKEFSALLNLPPHVRPFSLVVIGYPESVPPQPQDRFKPAKIHHNAW